MKFMFVFVILPVSVGPEASSRRAKSHESVFIMYHLSAAFAMCYVVILCGLYGVRVVFICL